MPGRIVGITDKNTLRLSLPNKFCYLINVWGEVFLHPGTILDNLSPNNLAGDPIFTEGRLKDNFYHNFGTYYLDSLTSFSDALMNAILAKDGIAGKPPRFTKDYVPQKVAINNALNQLLNLPCDVIVTAHLEVIRDEISGQFIRRLMTTGKGVVTVPLLFDEIWVMQTKETSKGIERRILLESTGRDLARSRLAACGKLEPLEEPNIERLLKKAGITTETKPLPGTWNVD